MPIVEPELALLRLPRLAALATSAWPAWLWSADASRILWANAVGAAIFGAPDVTQCSQRHFTAQDSSAAQVSRLAATLPSASQERLERLRGFGAGFGRALLCMCSRIVLPEGSSAILIAATEPAGPALQLGERVRRLFSGTAQALAVFTADGALLHSTIPAKQRLGGASTLSSLGIEGLGAKALEAGQASGLARVSEDTVEVTAQRLGKGDTHVLVLTLPPPPSGAASQQSIPANNEAVPSTSAPQPQVEAPAAPAISIPQAVPPAEPAPIADIPHDPSVAERRHPLRFVWQMDADGRFLIGSDEFIELVGPRTIAACGRMWSEIVVDLKLDPENRIARAIATRETWSGIQISWPVDDASERLPVEMSGLPVFGRDRAFCGYRGFGVCRNVLHINQLARVRRTRPITLAPVQGNQQAATASVPTSVTADLPITAASPHSTEEVKTAEPAAAATAPAVLGEAPSAPAREERPEPNVMPSANVVPFRPGPQPEPNAPSLSAVERRAFRELAQELTARLRGAPPDPLPAEGPQATVELAAAPGGDTITAPDAAARAVLDIPTESVLLDRIPVGVLVYRADALLYANRHFLEWTGYEDLGALAVAGGLNALFAGPATGALADAGGAQKLSIRTRRGDKIPLDGRLLTVPWNGAPALALILTNGQADERDRAAQSALGAAENEIRELKSIVERTARREGQKAAAAKAEFLARVSHEIRTPLNSMIGFAEVIMAERFGAIGNERYREYLKDMHAAGTHLVSLLNDLLDLSKIETGQLDLNFVNIDLNDLTQQCVAIMQPQANRARIIIRTSLTQNVPQVFADQRSLRQIVLNLLSNGIKFTGPGGQVIVSTAVTDRGEAVLRVRDTGLGMSEADIDAALEPFRQTATAGSWGSGGANLGLPLTKALAEANRANFSIKSAPNAGTLVEIAFPPLQKAAE
jgi:signal transduction histidine kinase